MEKRKIAEMNEVRASFYAEVANLTVDGHAPLGMTAEGFVFTDADGKSVVVKVITKALEFDAETAVEEFIAKEADKAAKEIDRASKASEKAEKAAERARLKAEKDAEKAAK